MLPVATVPHRALSLVRVTDPVPMILVVPVDPTGRLPPALPLLGLIACRCASCHGGPTVFIRVPPGFLRRLFIPGPEQAGAIESLVRRYRWLSAPPRRAGVDSPGAESPVGTR